MAAAIITMAIRDGRMADFRQFVSELMTSRRIEWAQSHRRRGITRQVTALSTKGDRSLAVIYLEGADPAGTLDRLGASDHEFDRWLAGRVDELLENPVIAEVLSDTARRRGPWRGMRRWRW